jgi:hypothetical protein
MVLFIWWSGLLNFQLVFSRTAKNRLISRFSLFKVLLLLGYISECSINLRKDEEICFCYFDEAEFWNFLLNSRKSHFSKPEVKTRKKTSDLVESTIKLKHGWCREENLPTAFWNFEGFWSKIGFQCFPKKILKKWKFRTFFGIFLFVFFNKFMLSECSLAMSCYFYT